MEPTDLLAQQEPKALQQMETTVQPVQLAQQDQPEHQDLLEQLVLQVPVRLAQPVQQELMEQVEVTALTELMEHLDQLARPDQKVTRVQKETLEVWDLLGQQDLAT
jgi:adenylate cyclase